MRDAWKPVVVLVEAQAEDEGLWCVAGTAMEAYLQQELRRLHAVIEDAATLGIRPVERRQE